MMLRAMMAFLIAPLAASSAQAAAPAAAASPVPETTTATYGDWVVVCVGSPAARRCEAMTTARDDKGQPLAALSMGYPSVHEPVRMALRLAVNVTVAEPVTLTAGAERHVMPFRLCIPQGCIADKVMADPAALGRLRAMQDDIAADIAWKDAAGQAHAARISLKGLNAAFSQLSVAP